MANNKNVKTKVPSGLSAEVGAMIEDFSDKLGIVAEQTGDIKKKIVGLSEDMEIVKSDLELIKYGLKRKVDIDDFQALEHRVALLENRR